MCVCVCVLYVYVTVCVRASLNRWLSFSSVYVFKGVTFQFLTAAYFAPTWLELRNSHGGKKIFVCH